jgi:hypothetical protein
MKEHGLTTLLERCREVAIALEAGAISEIKPELILDLLPLLAEPKPEIRDRLAWATISKLLRHQTTSSAVRLDVINVLLTEYYLFAAPLSGFSDTAALRSFSVLSIADAIHGDGLHSNAFATDVLSRISDKIRKYILSEKDARGFDDKLGWIHCFAHAGDCFYELANHPNITNADISQNIRTMFDFIETQGRAVFRWGEEYRLARPIAASLKRDAKDELFSRFTDKFMRDNLASQNFYNVFRAAYLELLWSDTKHPLVMRKLENIIRM